MKKRICLFILLCLFVSGIAGCAWKLNTKPTNPTPAGDSVSLDRHRFFDNDFREYISENIDTDGNGSLSKGEIEAVSKIDVTNRNIRSLEGIEVFRNLKYLNCSGTKVMELNMKGFDNLEYLVCSKTRIGKLEVNGLTNLTELDCSCNESMTNLEVSGCSNLTKIDCSGSKLCCLEISDLANLEYLDCSDNQLPELKVNDLTNLNYLACESNLLTNLKVNDLTNLKYLACLISSMRSSGSSSPTDKRIKSGGMPASFNCSSDN